MWQPIFMLFVFRSPILLPRLHTLPASLFHDGRRVGWCGSSLTAGDSTAVAVLPEERCFSTTSNSTPNTLLHSRLLRPGFWYFVFAASFYVPAMPGSIVPGQYHSVARKETGLTTGLMTTMSAVNRNNRVCLPRVLASCCFRVRFVERL